MVEVQELEFPVDVIDKLATKHGVTVEECRQAFTEDPDRMAVWTRSKSRTYGRRLKIVGRTSAGRLLVGYLYPTEEAMRWRIATAWEVRR